MNVPTITVPRFLSVTTAVSLMAFLAGCPSQQNQADRRYPDPAQPDCYTTVELVAGELTPKLYNCDLDIAPSDLDTVPGAH
jgi:hypothetical protein